MKYYKATVFNKNGQPIVIRFKAMNSDHAAEKVAKSPLVKLGSVHIELDE